MAADLSIRQMSEALGFSVSGVRHWLRRYRLETRRIKRLAATEQGRKARTPSLVLTCRHHGLTKFRLLASGGYRCVRCSSEAVSRRRRRVKDMLVQEAGGKCAVCRYDRYAGALHFHHLDPSEKSFVLSRNGCTRSISEAREEAAKCLLLCSNCHAEVEAGIVQVPGGVADNR